MDNEPVFRTEEVFDEQPRRKKTNYLKIIIGFLAFLLLITSSSLSFYFGKKSGNNSNEKQAATIFPSPTYIPTEAPTPTNSDTATQSGRSKSKISPTPSPFPNTKVLKAIPSLDGYRSSNENGNSSVDIRSGRNINLVTRGYVSFDLTELPQGLNVIEAKLKMYQARTIGAPYSNLGNLLIDQLTYGDILDSSDYASAALLSSFAMLSKTTKNDWKEADVSIAIKDDLANARARAQFRIHFEEEVKGGDVSGDFAYFESAENSEGTGNTPQLLIKYY